MTARSAQGRSAESFTAPELVNQRRYEALRAFFVDGLTHAQVAERFPYTRGAVVALNHTSVAEILTEEGLGRLPRHRDHPGGSPTWTTTCSPACPPCRRGPS